MTRSLSRFQAAFAGLLVLTGVAGAAYGLFAVGDRQRLWSGTFTVHVGFDKVQGVGVGTAVRIRGLEAGTVAAVDLPKSGQADAPLLLRIDLDPKCARMLFADATAQIRSEGMVGGKVIELDPGTAERGPLANASVIASKPPHDMNDVIDQAAALVNDVKNGQGSLGKLLRDDKAYQELAGTLEQTRNLMQKSQDVVASIQQDADAIKKLPIVRGYVEDSTSLLVRHTGERYRQVFATDELFEPRRAVLTEAGKAKLRGLSDWLTGVRFKGSDVVVAAFADPQYEPNLQVAHTLTVRQSEVASQYLQDEAGAHKLGWWSRRKVTAIGMGTRPTPATEPEPLPPARIEVIVFVP
jgi:phospholipid/cholesterol/gamma-HCH transport system substrate-binding protein